MKAACIHLVFWLKVVIKDYHIPCMFIICFGMVSFFFFFLDLHRLSELQELPVDLEPYVKKLMNSRRRVMLVNNILQNAQVRNV